MSTETSHIAELPFSDGLKKELYTYIKTAKSKNAKQSGCALIGCPISVTKMLLTAIADDLGCKLIVRDFQRNPIEREGELVSFLNDAGESDIVAFFNVNQMSSTHFSMLRDAVVNYCVNIQIGKGPSAQRFDLELAEFRVIMIFDEKNSIPFDLREGLFTTIDMSNYRVELRKEMVLSTLRKYELSINDQAATQIAELTCTEQEILSRLFEVRNRAFEAGIKEINEVFLSGKQENIPDIEIVDNLDGRGFELFAGDLFRGLGFSKVVVTPSSGDYGADVIAEKDDVRYAIQCKRYNSPVGVSAVQEVIASKSLHDCHVACVLTNNTFTPAAYELAKKNLVILWERNKLKEFIDRTK